MVSEITKIPSAILDNGSGLCKVGISGEQSPRFIQATVLGYPQNIIPKADTEPKACYVGQDAQDKRNILTLRYPMQHGIVTSWDDMEKIWKHLYEHGLREPPEQRPVLLTEAPLNPPENRAKMIEIFFETFQVPALYVALQGLMALKRCHQLPVQAALGERYPPGEHRQQGRGHGHQRETVLRHPRPTRTKEGDDH
uniref:Uncharacterized protein n=1 Tax=Sarcophilus harrisii TaxID=9305 RepID=A0A7N4PII9_SARHA